LQSNSEKVDLNFVIASFATKITIKQYADAVEDIGLWNSEKVFITKYLPFEKKILDLGCGAGRTTFGLYELGYQDLTGLDISPDMINEAKKHRLNQKANIPFIVGDAGNLPFNDQSFDGCLFPFNGLMQVPTRELRIIVLKEIHRILKSNCPFIFTTHDRDISPIWKLYWEEEARYWQQNKQDKRLREFGDMILEDKDKLLYIHVPTRNEILSCLKESGLELVEDAWRSEIAEEPEVVKKFAGECRFWAVRKP